MLHRLVVQAAVLMAVSVLLGAGVNALRSSPLPWRNAATAAREVPIPAEQRLTLEQAKAMHARADVLFIDARTAEEFALLHVAGAYNLPFDPFAMDMESRLKLVPTGKTLVIYCSSSGCALSEELAQTMAVYGRPGAKVMPDGIEGWAAAGGPVEGSESAAKTPGGRK